MGHAERVPRVLGLAFAAVMLACLATPVTAGAHLRAGTVAVDYQASVRHPDTPADTTQIFQSDRALGITVKPGHTVVLLGYLGEPVFRLDDAGLWLNQTSPTAAADRLVPKTQRTAAPGPRWRLRRGRHSLVWQDARVQGLPAGVARGAWSDRDWELTDHPHPEPGRRRGLADADPLETNIAPARPVEQPDPIPQEAMGYLSAWRAHACAACARPR